MKNMPASVRARLLNIAKKEKVPFQKLLTLYNQEGLLHRIVSTEYEFDQISIDINPITGQTEHGGICGTIIGYLGTARTRIQIDMGFGDVITDGPVLRPYRTILENRSFSMLMYSDETVAAEKLEAFVSLGVINSRYKDLYDLFELLVVIEIPENKIVEASIRTFRNRRTSLPEFPESLSDHYWTSTSLSTEWHRFLHRIEASSPDLDVMRKTLLPRLRLIYEKTRKEILKRSMDSKPSQDE